MTKNSRTKKIILAILTMALSVIMFACTRPTVPEPTAEEVLATLIKNFSADDYIALSGKISRDGIILSEVRGNINNSDKKIRLDIDGSDYLYGSKYLIKGDYDVYKVYKPDTSFINTLSLIPFNMFDFKYQPNRKGEIIKLDNHIIITFLSGGVKDTFNSPLSVSGGVFSITYDNNRVTETVLTTTLTENNKQVRYSAHYTYFEGIKAFEAFPWVAPENSLSYAVYALTRLSAEHGEETLHTASNDMDTGVMMGAFGLYTAKISNAFMTSLEDTYILNIEYSEKQVIPQLTSNMTALRISYGKDFRVKSITVNNANNYIVRGQK